MKKLLAWTLSLCLLLALVPGMAESGAEGTWYMVMVGLTAGTMELKADGTCVMTASDNGEVQTTEGTWTQDGASVSVQINGGTLPLTLDGDSLQFDPEGLAALNLDLSEGSGMDASLISSLIQISREPGRVTTEEFSAYQENGTLPEGKTEEDMQAVQMEMMTALMALMGAAEGAGLSSGLGDISSGEAAGPELTVVEDNFYIREGYGGQEAVYIARVQNNNDVPAYLSGGVMILLDENGLEAGSTDYLGTTGSRYLEPGETTFVSIFADVYEGFVVTEYSVQLTSSAISYQTPDTAVEVSATEIRKEEGYYTNYYGTATVTNTADHPQSRINAIIAIRSSDGKLVDLLSAGLYQNELAAGSTITLVDGVDSRTVDYLTQEQLTPDQAEAIAYIETW